MTENTEAPVQTREELEAELAVLRGAVQEAPEAEFAAADGLAALSTRDRSPIKPDDHKPADAELLTIEHMDVKFQFKKGAFNQLRTLDLLERGLINTALRAIVGDKSFEEFLDKNPEADSEAAGKLLEALSEKAGTKN